MEIPFLVRTAAAAEGLPLLALLGRRNFSRPVRWVAAGAAVSILGTLLGQIAAAKVGNNHWVATIDDPCMFALFFMALEEWQVTQFERLTFKIALYIVLVVYVLLVAFVEDVSTFGRFGIPILSLVVTAGGAWTLLRRGFRTTDRPLWSTDWCWIAGGLTLYAGTTLITEPIGAVLLNAQRFDLFSRVWAFRAACVDVAMLAIALGILRPSAPLTPPR